MHFSPQYRPLTPYRRLLLFACVSLAILLTHRIFPRRLFQNKHQEIHIQGRWKALREELGLAPLPDTFVFPSEDIHESFVSRRFGIKRKRSTDRQVELYFAPDALEERSATNEEILEMLYSKALHEKERAAEAQLAKRKGQERNTGRRPLSWTRSDHQNRRGKGF